MLRLGGLLALIALAAAAFWLATSWDREQPAVPEQAAPPPAERDSIEARPGPAPATPQMTRAPAGAPTADIPAATPVRGAASTDGEALPPLVLPPPEPPPTQLW